MSLAPVSLFRVERDEHRVQPASIADLLVRAARQHQDSGIRFVSAQRDSESTFLTYPALLDEACRILGGLRSRRRAGAKVALLLERAADFIPAFWACVLGGYVPCPLAPIRNDPERWAKHLAHVSALLDQPLLITTSALKKDLPADVSVADLDVLRASVPAELAYPRELAADAMLVLTSGSTGNSKAVVLTHGNLLASMAAKTMRQDLTSADITLNWISFDHVAALIEAHLFPLYLGAMQVHAEPAAILADPLLFLRLIDRHAVSMTFTPNFLLGQINAAIQAETGRGSGGLPHDLDLSCLRHIICGGEAVVVDTGRRFLDLMDSYGLAPSALWPAFGMTETCAGSVYSDEFPEHDMMSEFASLGLPVDGFQMRIVDEYGAVLPPGATGELQVRGPMVFSRYHNNEEATRAAFTADGWFRTGDLGRIENGRLSLVGRSKDSIIVSGVNYFSHELESALQQLEGIERSFVAVFPTRPAGADTEQVVVTFAATFGLADEERLHQLMVAVRNTVILLWGFRPGLILPLPPEAFPKTSLGKIQRGILRKRLETGTLAAHVARIAEVTRRQLGAYAAPETPVEAVITRIYADMFGLEATTLSTSASFFDLGGTSLEIIELKQRLEAHFACADLSLVQIMQNPSVRALAARVDAGRHPGGIEYDPIVPLQLTGAKTPLFCVHPGVGEVLVFVNLANYFVSERPFYALRARGLNEGEAYFSSFEELVASYADAIRKRQPHGPYALAGYSYGGPVAFELARLFESQGERVAFVGCIDMPPSITHPMGDIDAIDSAVILAYFLSLIDRRAMDELPARLRAARPAQDPCEYLMQVAPPERLAELDLDLPRLRAWAALAQSLVTIGRTYAPVGTIESMTVFHAQPLRGTKEDWLNEQLKLWDRHVRSPVRYVEVAGEHHVLMDTKHVAGFQAALRAELHRALGND